MKSLVSMADIITPNITEASMLRGKEVKLDTVDDRKNILKQLADMGPDKVVITSVPENNSRMSVIAYERNNNCFWKMEHNFIDAYYPGTGDIFTSVLTGAVLNGDSLPMAMNKAVSFLSLAIKTSYGYNIPRRNGVMFERVIAELPQQLKVLEYETF